MSKNVFFVGYSIIDNYIYFLEATYLPDYGSITIDQQSWKFPDLQKEKNSDKIVVKTSNYVYTGKMTETEFSGVLTML